MHLFVVSSWHAAESSAVAVVKGCLHLPVTLMDHTVNIVYLRSHGYGRRWRWAVMLEMTKMGALPHLHINTNVLRIHCEAYAAVKGSQARRSHITPKVTPRDGNTPGTRVKTHAPTPVPLHDIPQQQ